MEKFLYESILKQICILILVSYVNNPFYIKKIIFIKIRITRCIAKYFVFKIKFTVKQEKVNQMK